MRVRITKPCRVNLLSGEVEVSEMEYKRLLTLKLIDTEAKETPEVEKKQTRKARK